MQKGLRDAIALGESRLSKLETLRVGGLKSLAASGSLRVISGETTVGELLSAVGPSFWPELAAHYGTSFDADAAGGAPTRVAAGQSVLVIGSDDGLPDRLRPALEALGLRVTTARSAEEAHSQLQQDENIVFVIGDLDEQVTLSQAVDQLRKNRLHIAWARLPALVLLPERLVPEEAALRASGVMASFMAKPVDPQRVADHIRQAQAR